jgi:hypothetical protein
MAFSQQVNNTDWGQPRVGKVRGVSSRFYRPNPLLFIHVAPQLSHEPVDPVPDHYFSENLVAPEIESGTSGSVAKNSDH